MERLDVTPYEHLSIYDGLSGKAASSPTLSPNSFTCYIKLWHLGVQVTSVGHQSLSMYNWGG